MYDFIKWLQKDSYVDKWNAKIQKLEGTWETKIWIDRLIYKIPYQSVSLESLPEATLSPTEVSLLDFKEEIKYREEVKTRYMKQMTHTNYKGIKNTLPPQEITVGEYYKLEHELESKTL